MDSGGQFATISLVKLMLMWLVASWALLLPRDMEEWAHWGKPKYYDEVATSDLQCNNLHMTILTNYRKPEKLNIGNQWQLRKLIL